MRWVRRMSKLTEVFGESVPKELVHSFHLTRVDAVEKGIAVIKLGMNNRGGYCAHGLVIRY